MAQRNTVRDVRLCEVVNDADTGGAQTLVEHLGRLRPVGTRADLVVLRTPGAMSGRYEAAYDSVTYCNLSRASASPGSAIKQLRAIVELNASNVVHSHL